MTRSTLVNQIMFDWEKFSVPEIVDFVKPFPNKLLRWLAAHHPDNRTRKIFLEMTGVTIGEDTVINQNMIISDNYKPLLKIGRRVAISPNVTIICASSPNNSHLNKLSYINTHLICEKEVIIGDDVWVGANVVILPGVKIGNKTIIGAGAVVSKSLDSNSIYVGFPIKKIRNLNGGRIT